MDEFVSGQTAGRAPAGRWAWAALAALPAAYVVVTLVLRAHAMPFWLWHNLDPDYFYLLDSLNVLNLTTPGHVYHPGTTVQWLGALVLKAAYPFTGPGEITRAVLADPERHLRLIGNLIVALNGGALFCLGGVVLAAFRALGPALMAQTAPFLSMLVLKHGLHVKPEALLVLATLSLATVTVCSLRPGALERRGKALAIAFGVVAGFGVATKITAAPVFLLPLFLLGRARGIAIYGAAAALSFVVFTLPMAGAYDQFAAWIAKVFLGSGAFGAGTATIIDPARYPADVIRMFSRPVLHVPFVLALLALGHAGLGRRWSLDVRALAGVCLAQLAHVLVVAKQPSAVYLIPSIMLSALTLALLWRLYARRPGLVKGAWALLLALTVAQGAGIVRLHGELRGLKSTALALDNDRFSSCLRAYSLFASSRTYALYLADYVTGSRFSERLGEQEPANDYWFENWWNPSAVSFRDWSGKRDLSQAMEGYTCIVIRGGSMSRIEPYLAGVVPGVSFTKTCSTPNETVLTSGVDCAGHLIGR